MDKLLILDMGGTQSQSIARRLRGESVYCEIAAGDISAEKVREKEPKGLVLVGGMRDASAADAPDCAQEIYEMGLPMLCLGYGARIAAKHFGAQLHGAVLEERPAHIEFGEDPIFAGLSECDRFIDRADAWTLPEDFVSIAAGDGFDAAFACPQRQMWGMQFYPESNDPDGLQILANFADICGCAREWTIEQFISDQIDAICAQVGDGHALIAISGGIDSAVCAALMHKAIGERMHCVHVDTGLMRKDEAAMIARVFSEMGVDLRFVSAQERFLNVLRGVTDPEEKRRLIGREFVRVFEEEAEKIGEVEHLAQGTIYPDVLSSGGDGRAVFKSRHNVAGMPEKMRFKSVVEPLRALFKDEVRRLGSALGLPEEMVRRQPFPGPGLAVRCIGEVTREKLEILREADAIFREEIAKAGLDKRIWQYFAVLTDMQSVGVRDGVRTYDHTVALRAINFIDAANVTAVRLPYDLLETCVSRITSEVPGVNRVVYDITGKPPATVEWE